MGNLYFTAFALNSKFDAIWPLDTFSAFVWVDRYWAAGEFQLEVPWNVGTYEYLKVGNYLYFKESDQLMIIDKRGLTYDSADRSSRRIVVKGRNLSSLLDRRIIWGEWSFSKADFQSSIIQLIRNNVTNPSDTRRRIDILSLKTNSNYPKESFTSGGYGDNLYDVVSDSCESFGTGFKVVYDDSLRTNTFQLYKGEDRSYEQTKNIPVIFSSAYENLGPCRFALDTTDYKTVALARGGEDDGHTTVEVGALSLTGLDRREMYVSASATEPEGIAQKAMEQLAKVNTLETLDAELDSKRQFLYNRDYFIGDIVQVITDFGLDARARVIEFARSWDESGYQEVPTFKILKEGE